MTNESNRSTSGTARTEDRREYRLIFTAAFALFFLVGIVERLLVRPLWSSKAAREHGSSVLEQAKSSASIAASAGLMG